MAEATLIVLTDESGAKMIDRIVQDNGGSAGIVTEEKHLGGEVATYIVAVTAFTQALPPLLAAIKDLLTHKRVTEIQVGDTKITDPTPEVVEQVLKERLGSEK